MIIICPAISDVIDIIGKQSCLTNNKRESSFCVKHNLKKGCLFYNTFTKELLFVDNDDDSNIVQNYLFENWFLVDSIGVANDDFHLHFEIQEEIVSRNSGSHKETNDKRFIEEEEQMFKQILESFGYYDMIEDKNEKETWWDKLINYIFV